MCASQYIYGTITVIIVGYSNESYILLMYLWYKYASIYITLYSD